MSAPDLERLPCGCRMGTVNDAFVLQPCSLDCKYALYAIAETQRLGKPIHAMDAKHAGSIPTIAEIACPHCGRMNSAHSRDTGDRPEPGNIGVCWGCRKFSVYDMTPFGALTQRVPTPEEQQEIDDDPLTKDIMTALRESYTPSEATDFARRLRR